MSNPQFVSFVFLVYGASFFLIYLIEFGYEGLALEKTLRDFLGGLLLGLVVLAIQVVIRTVDHPAMPLSFPDGRFLLILLSLIYYGIAGGTATLLALWGLSLALGYQPLDFLIVQALVVYLLGLGLRHFIQRLPLKHHPLAILGGTALSQFATLGTVALLMTDPGTKERYFGNFPSIFLLLEIYALGLSMIFISNRAGQKKLLDLEAAENALRNRTAFLEALLNSSTDGIIVVDSQGKKTLQNRRAVELWKLPPAINEIADDSVQVSFAKSLVIDPEAFASKVAYLYSHPEESSLDEIGLVDGTILERYSAPVVGAEGQPFGRIWGFHDITDIRTSERRLWGLFEDSPIAIWEEDFSRVKARIDAARANGVADWAAYLAPRERVEELIGLVRVLDINAAALSLLGYGQKSDVLEGKGSLEGREELIAIFRPEFLALASGSRSYESEGIHLNAKGEPIHVLLKLSIMPGFEETWSRILVSTVDVSDRVRATEELRQSLAEKETLLREVHHRVKNNLQIICSLISMQQNSGPGSARSDPSLVDLETRVRTIALVHEMLYQSDTFASVDFSSYVRRLSDYLLEVYSISPSLVHIEIIVEGVELSLEKAIPCGILLNELLVNSFKHAFPGGRRGGIWVKLVGGPDGRIHLRVSDDGIGAAPADLGQGRTGSFGLSLVRSMALQLGGECKITVDAGVKVEIDFPG